MRIANLITQTDKLHSTTFCKLILIVLTSALCACGPAVRENTPVPTADATATAAMRIIAEALDTPESAVRSNAEIIATDVAATLTAQPTATSTPSATPTALSLADQAIQGIFGTFTATPAPTAIGPFVATAVAATLTAQLPGTPTRSATATALSPAELLLAELRGTLTVTPTATDVGSIVATAVAATLTAQRPATPTPGATATALSPAELLLAELRGAFTVTPTATDVGPFVATAVAATLTALPTSSAPSVPTSAPLIYHTLSLAKVANSSTYDGYVEPPAGSVELGGVWFTLPTGRNSVTTQAEPLPDYPTRVILPDLELTAPQAVYLLLTGGNTRTRFTNRPIGAVVLHFASGQQHEVALVAGQNLREWKVYGDQDVSVTTATTVRQVWATNNHFDSGQAIIDLLTVPVPQQLKADTLTGIELRDDSATTVGSLDPALNLLGLTVLAR